jgi:hypothetical protein
MRSASMGPRRIRLCTCTQMKMTHTGQCKHKNAIHKVMFYSSVAKPRFDDEGRCYFDGKLGI